MQSNPRLFGQFFSLKTDRFSHMLIGLESVHQLNTEHLLQSLSDLQDEAIAP